MMKLETKNGKIHEVELVATSLRGRMLVVIPYSGQKVSEIAPDFEGVEEFTAANETRGEGVFETFKGFTQLTSYSVDKTRGVIRLTLERGDGA